MEAIGVMVTDIAFTGFWSQGDGASFEGFVVDNKVFYQSLDIAGRFPLVEKLVERGGMFDVRVRRDPACRYCHENSVMIMLEVGRLASTVTNNDFMVMTADALQPELDMQANEVEKLAAASLRSHMHKLYKDLEAEYEHLTREDDG